MEQDEMLKRIISTKYDIFPLDRMLPAKTVFKIFSDIYNNEPRKSLFFKDRKYQRLREGYWSLFVCKALEKWQNKEYFISFPVNPANDVNFISHHDSEQKLMNKLVFDVKEFTKYSKNFKEFVKEKINPKRNIYGIIIGLMENVDGLLLKSLLVDNKKDKGVFVVAALNKDDQRPYNVRVIYFKENQVIFDYEVDVNIDINNEDPIFVFQNILRDKT